MEPADERDPDQATESVHDGLVLGRAWLERAGTGHRSDSVARHQAHVEPKELAGGLAACAAPGALASASYSAWSQFGAERATAALTSSNHQVLCFSLRSPQQVVVLAGLHARKTSALVEVEPP